MNNNILTLEQMEKMSIDEITDAYRNGYVLSESNQQLKLSGEVLPQTYSPQIYSTTNTPQIYSATNGHYTTSDIGIITTAIAISVGLLGLLTWYIIRKEEERIISQVKEAVISATQKASLVERLIPIVQRIGERLLPAKA
jgi:hypothetical protein